LFSDPRSAARANPSLVTDHWPLAPPLLSQPAEVTVNWFNLSFIGWVILIIALAIAAYMVHIPMVWIGIGALALIGIGIIVSVSKSKPQI
jgi:hypothetical protein